jgi:hypothetical protein
LIARELEFAAPQLPRLGPKVVAVVLNWNGWLDTVECIESVLRSAYAVEHVIVCDNGSSDGSVAKMLEWAEGLITVDAGIGDARQRWSYVPSQKPIAYTSITAADLEANSSLAPDTPLIFLSLDENRGYAGGNNAGLRFAIERYGAEFVWILNNDTVIDRHALESMLSVATQDSAIGMIGPKVLRYDRPDTIQAVGGGRMMPYLGYESQHGRGQRNGPRFNNSGTMDHLIGASLLVRAEAVRDVGVMDESYFLYREETDWCVRMRRNGWKMWCCANATVWHKEGKSLGFKSVLHDYYSVRNFLLLVRRFYPLALPSAILIFGLRAVVPKLGRLQFRRLFFVLLAFRDFAFGKHGRVHAEEFLTQFRG